MTILCLLYEGSYEYCNVGTQMDGQATDTDIGSSFVRPISPPSGSGIVRAKPRLPGPGLDFLPGDDAHLGSWTPDEGT